MRITKVMGIAAVVAVSAPLLACAQGSARMQADTVAAGTPEARRLHELVTAINTGDASAMRAYLMAHSISRNQSWDPFLLSLMHELYRISTGFELVRVTTIPAQQFQPQLQGYSVAILRNKATGGEHALSIALEAERPHRITGLPILHPSLAALLTRPAAPVSFSEPEKLQEIGAYLKRLSDADVFSGVVVVMRDRQPVFSQAYGYADRDRKIPNTLATPFMLGSMNKLFTGLAIGQLVEQGRLSYDDPLSKFLPDFPDRESAAKIRIKHLLSHTAGLGDYSFSKPYKDALDRMTTVEALVGVLGRERPKFDPGTKWAYSNSGFVVLGRVIEIVTGEAYYDYMAKNVFAPAGMKTASFPVYPKSGIAPVPMAYPYEWEFKGDRLSLENKLGDDFRRGGPSGVGLASALDLIEFASAVHNGRVVKSETLQLHSTSKPELSAPNYGYGFAVGMRKANNRDLVGHGGNAYGSCTEFGTIKDTPYSIIILSNLTIGGCVAVTGKMMRVLTATNAPAR